MRLCCAAPLAALVVLGVVPGLAAAATAEIVPLTSVAMLTGDVEVTPPPIVHFMRDAGGALVLRTHLKFEDLSAHKTWLGRLRIGIWREDGGFGSNSWTQVWSHRTEFGNRSRHPKLRDFFDADLDTPVLQQAEPVTRYRVEVRASSHGVAPRSTVARTVLSVVLKPPVGRWEAAPTLLVSRQAWRAHRSFADAWEQVHRRRVSKRHVRRALLELHDALASLDAYGVVLPATKPLEPLVAWAMSVHDAARKERGIATLVPADLKAPFYCVTDDLVLEALRDVRTEIPSDAALKACERAIGALEAYGYLGTQTGPNLRYEMQEAGQVLTAVRPGYLGSILDSRTRFEEIAGRRAWPGGPEPKEKYLDGTFARTERFFNVPAHVAHLQAAAMRALAGLEL